MIKIIKNIWHNLFRSKECNDGIVWPKTLVFDDSVPSFTPSLFKSNPTIRIKLEPYKEKKKMKLTKAELMEKYAEQARHLRDAKEDLSLYLNVICVEGLIIGIMILIWSLT